MATAVITGIGIACPLGVGHEAFWSAFSSQCLDRDPPNHEIAPRSGDPEGVPAPRTGSVFLPEFQAERYADPRALRKVSDLTRLLTVASHLSLDDASFPEDRALRQETGVYFGTCFGSSAYHLEYHETLRREGVTGASALLFSHSVFNAPSGHVGQTYKLRGGNLTLVGGETIGLDAISDAADRVRAGIDRAALAGGADQYSPIVHASLHQSGLIGEHFAQAFDESPTAIAEGAATVLLEEADAARARHRTAYAEVAGSGRARAGKTGTGESALRRAIAAACDEAKINPSQLDLLICGASGGKTAPAQRVVLEALLSEAPDPVSITPKDRLGEGFAFTSAALLVIGALSFRYGVSGIGKPIPANRSALPSRVPSTVLIFSLNAGNGASAVVLRQPGPTDG